MSSAAPVRQMQAYKGFWPLCYNSADFPMEGDSLIPNVLGLLAVVILVLINAFFVAAEFALVSVRPTRIAELVASGNRMARWVASGLENPDRFIAATQLGITLASLGLGWIGEPALSGLIEPLVQLFPAGFATTISRTISAVLAFVIITFMHVVVGELMPKSIALQSPERTSLLVGRPLAWTVSLFKPMIWALNGTGNALLRILGVKPAEGHELVHSVAELKMIVTDSAEVGVVAVSEREMLHAVFDFRETLVRQVMSPRTEVIAVPLDTALEQILETAVSTGFSKLPVYQGDLDQVVGVVHLKDVVGAIQSNGSATARDLMREAVFVPEAAQVDTLLQIFRARHQHLAIVLDEYGGTAGVATLEDLLEEIFGEVSDPFDRDVEIQALPDGSSLVNGLTTIADVNEHFGLKLSDPHYDTLAGFILGQLGRLAELGDNIVVDGARLRVVAMDGRRVSKVWVFPIASTERQTAE
ncbi:MAG: hemolysin family protein [Anaerolineales bacterium]